MQVFRFLESLVCFKPSIVQVFNFSLQASRFSGFQVNVQVGYQGFGDFNKERDGDAADDGADVGVC